MADRVAAAEILAAYVLYAESPVQSTVLLARVIVEAGEACPDLLDEAGGVISMTARENPDPKNFQIVVCEALYAFEQNVAITDTQLELPRVKREPSHVIVFGDTGCKGGTAEDCSELTAWPFPAFATTAAMAAPDLVIHVGDYNYIGTPREIDFSTPPSPRQVFDAGDKLPVSAHCQNPQGYVSQNVPESLDPDQWRHWQHDFFGPARELLMTAPFVFTRGNHELCSRAGPGWFYLLDASSRLLGGDSKQLSCPDQTSADPLLYEPPYRLSVGQIDLVVMDTSKACDITQTPELTRPFIGQFEALTQIVDEKPTWLVMHRPIWGIQKPKQGKEDDASSAPGQYVGINETLQQALRKGSRGILPRPVQLVVAGHLHRFQTVTFDGERPPQLIMGNGGFELRTDGPQGTFTTIVDGNKSTVVSENAFGYLDLTLAPDGNWEGQVVDRRPGQETRVLADCGTSQQKAGSVCMLRPE